MLLQNYQASNEVALEIFPEYDAQSAAIHSIRLVIPK